MAAQQNSAPNVSQAVPLSPLTEGPSVPTTAPAPSTLMEVLVAVTNTSSPVAAPKNHLLKAVERNPQLLNDRLKAVEKLLANYLPGSAEPSYRKYTSMKNKLLAEKYARQHPQLWLDNLDEFILKEKAALNNSLVQTQERVQRLETEIQNAKEQQARVAALEEQRSAHLATHRELVVPPVIGGLEPNRAALQATLGQISGHLARWQQHLSSL